MHKIGIVGATGYTGSELVRILIHHPAVDVSLITSESYAGKKFADIHPQFTGINDTVLQSADAIDNYDLDLVFLALPHGVSMEYVKKFRDRPFKMVDLSGDFRLQSPDTYEKWYNKDHTYREGFNQAAFGIPELFREKITESRLVANPGCFPTTAILGIAPLLKEGVIQQKPILVDAKTGVTGAGAKAKEVTHFPNVNDNFKAYGLKKHRHTIEIQEVLNAFAHTDAVVQFTPHLLPIDRGILSTIYAIPNTLVSEEALKALFTRFYADEPFVRVVDYVPETKYVRGTNYCDVHPVFDDRTGMVMVLSAIDNLVKGAAGQAVQNMNLLLGLDETTSLTAAGMNP